MLKNKKKIEFDSHFSTAEASPGFLLWKAANLLQRTHTSVLAPLSITPAQFSFMTCLVYLAKENDNVTSALIAKQSGMDKMMVSDLVKTLKKKKLIATVANPLDGRSFLIEPTDAGIKLTNQAVKSIERIDDDFFKAETKLDVLTQSLLRLIQENG